MVNYVEKATLRIIDDATPQINKINEALRKLNVSFKAFEKHSAFSSLNAQSESFSQKIDRINQNIKSGGALSGIPASNKKSIFTVDFNISPLKIWSVGFIARMGREFETALEKGLREGTTHQYIAQSRLNNLPLSSQDRRNLEKNIVRIRDQTGGLFNTTDIREEFADIFGITDSVKASLKLLPDVLNFARTSIATTGGAKDEGLAVARNMVKSLDVMSRLLTDQKGNFTGDKDKYLQALVNSYLISGKFLNDKQMITITRNLRTTGKTLDPEAFQYLLLQAESEGTRIGNSLNRLVVGLSGTSTKEARNNLIKYKLARLDKNNVFHLIDENSLRTNPYNWVSKHFTEGFARYSNLDINKDRDKVNRLASDRASLTGFIRAITSSMIASDELTSIVTDITQLNKRLALVQSLPNASLREKNDNQNALLQLKSVGSAFEQLAGTVGKSILDNLISPLNLLKKIIYGTDDFINKSDSSAGKAMRVLGAGTLGVGAAVGGIYGIKAISNQLFNFRLFNKGSQTLLLAAQRLLAYAGVSSGLKMGEEAIETAGKRGFLKNLAKRGLKSGLIGAGLSIGAGLAIDYADAKFGNTNPADDLKTAQKHKAIHTGLSISDYAIQGASIGALTGLPFEGIGAIPGGLLGGVIGTGYGVYENLPNLKDLWRYYTSPSSTSEVGNQKLSDSIDRLSGNIATMAQQLQNNKPVLASDYRREATGATNS